MDTKDRLVVPRGKGWMVGETEGGEKVQLPVNKFWGQEKSLDFPSHPFRVLSQSWNLSQANFPVV